VQSEYSLWTRDPETTVLPAMRELGVALVPYAPLGRGFLTGTVNAGAIGAGDMRTRLPRFSAAFAESNGAIGRAVAAVAERKGATAAQVALAWVTRSDG
jgi:aryl-alcohol dehydrogenase-like predicted oxidoreductase